MEQKRVKAGAPSPDDVRESLLIAHDAIRKRFRRIIALISILVVVVIVEGFAYKDFLNVRYLSRQQFLETLSAGSEFCNKAQDLYPQLRDEQKTPDGKPLATVLSRIEGLTAAVYDYHHLHAPTQRISVFGFRFDSTTTIMLVLVFPAAALIALLLTLVQLRHSHLRLRTLGLECPQTQMELNSLFYQRVTTRYGEQVGRHILLPAMIVAGLCLAIPLFNYSLATGFRVNDQITIESDGSISSDANAARLLYVKSIPTPVMVSFGLVALIAAIFVLNTRMLFKSEADGRRLGRRYISAVVWFGPLVFGTALVQVIYTKVTGSFETDPSGTDVAVMFLLPLVAVYGLSFLEWLPISRPRAVCSACRGREYNRRVRICRYCEASLPTKPARTSE